MTGHNSNVKKSSEISRINQCNVMDSLLEGCQIISPDFRYIYLNDAAVIHSKRSKEELLGSTMMEIYPGIENTQMFARLKLCMKECKCQKMDNEFIYPNGKVAVFELSMEQTKEGVLILSWDITKRKAEEQRFKDMSNLLNQTIFETDLEGYLTFANLYAFKQFGHSENSLLKKINVLQLIAPHDRKRGEDNFKKIILHKKVKEPSEYLLIRKDGSMFPAFIYSSAIIKDGITIGTRGLIVDVSEQQESKLKIENSLEKVQKTLNSIISTLSYIVETKDPYTSGHQKKVANLAVAIARKLGLEKNKINAIFTAAIIHDIGKIMIPASILSKPGNLNEIEFAFVKTHPQTGYDLLKEIDFNYPIADIILQHHERNNGSGYPNGLTSDEIMLEAKIIAVADVIEAMSSHRPYRSQIGTDKALKDIEADKGTLYDPNVVEVCITLFRTKKFTF